MLPDDLSATGNVLDFHLVHPVDGPPPVLLSSTPADEDVDVAVDVNIVLVFSKDVQAGVGNIVISDGSDTRTIDVSDATQVTIAGDTVTINPTADLLHGSTYNVQMASGVITDTRGAAFAGILTSTELNFSTDPGAPALLTAVLDAAGCSIELTFDKDIVSGDASLGFTRSVGVILSADYSGPVVTLHIPKTLQGAAVGTITYNAATGDLAGTYAEVPSFGPIAVTNGSTLTGTWASIASSSVAGSGWRAIAALDSTSFAYAEGGGHTLRKYAWNGSTYAQVGNSINTGNYTTGKVAICALDANNVAYIDAVQRKLRTYTWNGTQFAMTGAELSIGGSPSAFWLAALSSTSIALAEVIGDTLYKLAWSGSAWSVTATKSLTMGNVVYLSALDASTVALADYTNEDLTTYRVSGGTWVKVGNSLSIPAGVASDDRTVASLGCYAIAHIDAYHDSLQAYVFDNTNWATLGSALSVSSVSAGVAATTLDESTLLLVDSVSGSARKFTFT